MTILLLSGILTYHASVGQDTKTDSLRCSCSYTFYFSTPDVDGDDEREGTVIVEYEIDSTCIASNVRIIQSLGPVYDKEVLRGVRLGMALKNKCALKCKYSFCEKRKVKFAMTFKKQD